MYIEKGDEELDSRKSLKDACESFLVERVIQKSTILIYIALASTPKPRNFDQTSRRSDIVREWGKLELEEGLLFSTFFFVSVFYDFIEENSLRIN